MNRKKPFAKITGFKNLFKGFLSVTRYTIEAERHAGGTLTMEREVMDRGHAVAVLGYDPKSDEVLLVNEMRPGPLVTGDDAFSDALPAGMIDAGERPVQAAVREMKEETGMELKDPCVIHPGAYVSPGGTTERVTLVFGTIEAGKAGGVHGKLSEFEDIKTVILKADDFIARAEKGQINDMKTLVAAFWLAQHRPEIRERTLKTSRPGPARPG